MSVPKHHPTSTTKIYNNRIIIELIQRCFSKKNVEQMYQYLVSCRDKTYFVKNYSKSNNKYKQDEIIQMLDFLIDKIFVLFGGRVFQQTIGIPMGTKCGVGVAHIFSFLCCPIMYFYVLSSVLWCPLWFPHEKDVRYARPLVACRRAQVLFTLFVFVYV